jgi:polysaccharide biosynthesis/export protein
MRHSILRAVSRSPFSNLFLVIPSLAVVCLSACTSLSQNRGGQTGSSELSAVGANDGIGDPTSSSRLEAIWQTRMRTSSSTEFPIGPGDLVEVSVPAMPELKDRQARVSTESTIELPLLGIVNVKGMDESGVREAVRNRLKEYMKDPQVDVFVKQYRSREVAVAGMVQKPGLYTLTSRSDTILDMIGHAGGVKETASTRVIFIPAPASANSGAAVISIPAFSEDGDDAAKVQTLKDTTQTSAVEAVSAVQPVGKRTETAGSNTLSENQFAPNDSASTAPGRDPIVIDLATIKSNSQLDVPVWPGDVIIVPAAGEVMVRGWVKNPGAFNITPGMTVLGAITAAGGELFSSSAGLLRTADNGHQTETSMNLSRVQRGEEPDVAVQGGDVVVVNRSVEGAVPYSLYTIFNKFTIGGWVPFY